MNIEVEFKEYLKNIGHIINSQQELQFFKYYEMLIDYNQRMNLTGITEKKEVYIKHFYDSLLLVTDKAPQDLLTIISKNNSRLIDIGSGAGFPGLPLKILFPNLKVTFLDSLNKRLNYLQAVCIELGLEGCCFLHARAEDGARLTEYRDNYDIVTARAVARQAVLNELCLPFAKENGWFVSMKADDVQDELVEAEKSTVLLSAQLERVVKLQLPEDYGKRTILYYNKINKTNKIYPRKPGVPAKKPLI